VLEAIVKAAWFEGKGLVQDVIRHKTIAHSVKGRRYLGDIDLFDRIRNMKKDIRVMRVNEIVRNSTKQPGNDTWKASHQDVFKHFASGLLALARIEGK